jgi:hypothetical protein
MVGGGVATTVVAPCDAASLDGSGESVTSLP